MFLKRDAKNDLRQSIYRLWTAAGHSSVYQYNYKVSTYMFHRVFNYRNQERLTHLTWCYSLSINASVTKKSTAKRVLFTLIIHEELLFSEVVIVCHAVIIDTYSLYTHSRSGAEWKTEKLKNWGWGTSTVLVYSPKDFIVTDAVSSAVFNL